MTARKPSAPAEQPVSCCWPVNGNRVSVEESCERMKQRFRELEEARHGE
jgi:hypothetical protein